MAAINSFRGDSQPVAQVVTFVLSGVALNAVYTITQNRKNVTYTATGTDTNATATAALLANLQASTFGEFATDATWTSDANVTITGTAGTPGVPFTVTSSGTGGAGIVQTTTVNSSGPSHWDDANNWTAGWIPQSLLVTPTATSA